MSWKCDICDSYNDDSLKQCFVCGQTRSAESIKKAKIHAKEEKLSKLNEKIYKNSFGFLKIVFLAGTAVSLIAAVTLIIKKIVDGQLDSIWYSVVDVAQLAGNNIKETFGNNFPLAIQIIAQRVSANAGCFGDAFMKLLSCVGDSFRRLTMVISEIINIVATHF